MLLRFSVQDHRSAGTFAVSGIYFILTICAGKVPGRKGVVLICWMF